MIAILSFDLGISWDTICIIASVIGSAIAIWTKLNQDVALTKQRVKFLEVAVEKMEVWQTTTAKTLGHVERQVAVLISVARKTSKHAFEEDTPL